MAEGRWGMSREAFEKAYHKETGLYASWAPDNKGYTDVIAGMCYRTWQAAQAQAGKPIAAVHGWFHGECVIRALDPEAVLPAGMALYSQPQAQAVNQQLLEALVDLLKAARGGIKLDAPELSIGYIDAAIDAIAAAQQRHGAEGEK